MSTLVSEAKGRFAEMLTSTLLEWAGYRVLRLGIEETVSEVKAAFARGEGSLDLPKQLRTSPDFLVIDSESGECMLLEVKFRRTFDDGVGRGLRNLLEEQAEFWPEAGTILVVADPPGVGGKQYQDYLRLVMPGELDRLTDGGSAHERWRSLPTLGAVFSRVHDVHGFHAQADRIIPVIRGWG